MNSCECQNFDAVVCIASRHKASIELIRVLGSSCQCTCHLAGNGGEISRTEWTARKSRVDVAPDKFNGRRKTAI